MTMESELASSVPADVVRARELLRQEFEVWNSHDPERVLAKVTDGILWEDPSMPGGRLRGKQAVRGWLESMWRASPDMTFDPVGEPLIPADGRRIAVSWRATGHMTGAAYEKIGIEVLEFEGNLVRHESSFYDSAMPGRQFGVPPRQAPGQSA